MSSGPLRLAAQALVGIATVILIVVVSVVPFLVPAWLDAAQERAGVPATTGYTTADLRTINAAFLGDIVLGPPDFDVEIGGAAVLNERERSHLVDVRTAFQGLFVVAAVAAGVLLVGWWLGRGSALVRTASRLGATGLALGVAIGGLVGLLAFDVAFELFHRLLFPAGSYTFDPSTERLVQLYPQQVWIETTTALGILIVAVALGVRWLAGRRGSVAP